MDFRLNDLKHFVATSGCATLTQASHKLEITQPALSESLKRLEQDMGAILFFRSRNGIQLTSSGRALLARAQDVLQAIEKLNIHEEKDQLFAGRSITIGCHGTVASYSLPKSLKYLKEKAPDYLIQLKHDLSRNIQSAVQRGEIDVGIVVNPVSVPDLVIQRLAFDTVAVWSSSREKMMDTIICDPELFQTQSILKRWKNRPKKMMATDSLDLIARLVANQVGYGILPQRAIELIGKKFHQIDAPTYKDEISLVYRPEFGKRAHEKMVLEALKEGLKN